MAKKRKKPRTRRTRWKMAVGESQRPFPIPQDVLGGYICCWLTLMMFEIEPSVLQKFGAMFKQYKNEKDEVMENIRSSCETIEEIAEEDGEDIKDQMKHVKKTIIEMAAKIWNVPLKEVSSGIQGNSKKVQG